MNSLRFHSTTAIMSRARFSACLLLGTAMSLLLSIPAYANVPNDLTNFQNEYACDASTLIVRPKTLEDVAEAVRLHDHVQATGEGHSWNQPFFCAAPAAAGAASPAPAAPSRANTQPVVAGRRLLQAPADAAAGSNATSRRRPTSANIAMRTLRPLTISVNESDSSVWVDAGVITADLLQYLANYVTPAAPAGYTLGAFPWFIYQSIGGAVSTGTHGSNLQYKSLSNQVLALDVILANGTRTVITNQTHPFLMKAWRVSVGQLGVLGRVKLHIVKEVPVRRSLKVLTIPEFLQLMSSAQDAVVQGEGPPAWMNETQMFWLPQTQQVMFISFTRADNPDPQAAQSALAGFLPDSTTVFTKKGDMLHLGELELPADALLASRWGNTSYDSQVIVGSPTDGANAEPYKRAQRWVDGFLNNTINQPLNLSSTPESRTMGVPWTAPQHKPPTARYVGNGSAEANLAISAAGLRFVGANISAEAGTVYIKHPAIALPGLRTELYDQYEVSIPFSTMATCWRKIMETVYQGDLEGTNATQRAQDKGLRTASLIRFIGAEDGLLSHTHDGPRMYVNVEDYVFYNANRTVHNEPFRTIMALFTGDPACTGKGPTRLHWGKAGWPDKGCWHGDKYYGDNWCHFGCAVKQLDPNRKFVDSAPDRWTWAGVDLDKCCGADGFKVGTARCECVVKHDRAMNECPPAPFYTNR